MALIQTEGIILKSKKYSETSLILDIYTHALGMRSYIVSGVRKSKSKSNAGTYQIMTIVNLIAYDKNNDSLCRIKEAKTAVIYKDLPFNVIKSSIGMLLVEISHNAIQEKEANPDLYNFLKEWLIHLDQSDQTLGFKPVQFMIELTAHLGFYPSQNYSQQNPLFNLMEGAFVPESHSNQYCCSLDESHALQLLTSTDRAQDLFPTINNKTKAALFNSLEVYYQLHLEQFKNLKSIAILRQVLI